MPSWLIQTAADFDRYLDEQLERLQVDNVDFYLLHTLNKDSWAKLRDLGVRAWAEKAVAAGRFRYLGFSFHDDFEAFRRIVDEYDWPMCQIQYNYMDVQNRSCLEYAAAKGLAVVVMEPLLGGKLVGPSPSIQAVWDSAVHKRTPAGWALQWLWDQPEVSTVLSGMSDLAQTMENVALADASRIGALSAEELALYGQVRAKYRELTAIPCTGCRYCLPCPHNVDIPGNFGNYNDAIIYDKLDSSRGLYSWFKYAHEVQKIYERDIRAAQCRECGACEAKCPQRIPISKWMPIIHGVLGEGKPYVMKIETEQSNIVHI